MSLYLKYRPTKFSEMAGNEGTVSALKAMLKRDDRPHVYLFTGSSGTGKTTLARIMANKLGATGHDLLEIDSADYRGIDTIRQMRQQVRLKPMGSPCRIWILDEIHRATSDAQSALLKILEDTPSHVYFILCTTDPQKLLPTIVNRCMQFKLNPLTDDEMIELIAEIWNSEVEHEDDVDQLPNAVIDKIVDVSNGSPRKALVNLDKVINLKPNEMLDAITDVDEDDKEIIDLCRALIKKQPWKAITKIIYGLKGKEPESVRRAVLGYANAVLLKRDEARAFLILDAFEQNFYDSGRAGITLACRRVLYGE